MAQDKVRCGFCAREAVVTDIRTNEPMCEVCLATSMCPVCGHYNPVGRPIDELDRVECDRCHVKYDIEEDEDA